MLVLSDTYQAILQSEDAHAGEIVYVARNEHGGALLTPVAQFFAWQPEHIEFFKSYWRIDLYAYAPPPANSQLAIRNPMSVGESLVKAMKEAGICDEPIWLQLHQCTSQEGVAFGEIFEFDD